MRILRRLLLPALIVSVALNIHSAWRWKLDHDHSIGQSQRPSGRVEALAELYAQLPMDSSDVVLLGDSHFEYLPVNELFRGARVVNRGLSGQHANEVRERAHAIAHMHPRRVLLHVGVNDIMHERELADYTADMTAMLDLFAQEHVPVVVTSLLPNAHPGIQAKIEVWNRELRAMCEQRGTVFVDLDPALRSGNTMDPALTFDGLHLNAKGTVVFAGVLEAYVH